MVKGVVDWILKSRNRLLILKALSLPLTVVQIANRVGLAHSGCSRSIGHLKEKNLIFCHNKEARLARLYWLTDWGKYIRSEFEKSQGFPKIESLPRNLNWNALARSAHRQRSEVIKSLEGTMQAVTVRKKARYLNSNLKMSTNNCRDVIQKFLLKEGIVTKTEVIGKGHIHFKLTEKGEVIKSHLQKADTKVN